MSGPAVSILIVDDHALVREMLASRLATEDYLSVAGTGMLQGNLHIAVYDLTGRRLMQMERERYGSVQVESLDVSGLESGIYLLHVEYGGSRYSLRFIKAP